MNKKEIRAYCLDELPKQDKYEVALIGRSNCGKSSLINRLCGTSKARVSSTPGHTLWLGIHELQGVRVIDLPGYGHAATSHARKDIVTRLVWDYLKSGRLKMIFVLIDTRRGVLPIDQYVVEEIDRECIPIRFVGTKLDKKGTVREGLDFYCSSLTGEGVQGLRDYIATLPKSA